MIFIYISSEEEGRIWLGSPLIVSGITCENKDGKRVTTASDVNEWIRWCSTC